jgi:hypothetical protein
MICLGEPAPFLKSAPRPTAVTIGSPLSPVHYPKEMKMGKALGLIAVASVALAVWLSQVLAEDAAVPNLVGTWTGPLKVLRAKGDRQRHAHHSRD